MIIRLVLQVLLAGSDNFTTNLSLVNECNDQTLVAGHLWPSTKTQSILESQDRSSPSHVRHKMLILHQITIF